ncbi:MAG: DUF4097 family beta strand repeat protein, partial [Lachnospiraceae bacterium]|nr:DUF4097 family beta strand repeat protein [Lachnospiraceae bacterium]
SLPIFRDILDNSVLLFVAAGVLLVVVSASVENRYQEFAKAAVTVPKEHISFSGFDGTYEGGQENYEEASWNPGSESRVFEGYQRKQRKSLPWIIAGVVVFFLLFLCVFGVAAFLGVRRSVSTEMEEERTEVQTGKELHESYPADEVNKIQIDLDVADVVVKSGDVESIVLDYKGKEEVVESLSNGALVIKEQNPHGWISFRLFSFGWGNHEGSLQLTVPKDLYGSSEASRGGQTLSVATDTGDVQLKEVYFDEISVDVDTGDVTLEDVGGMGKGILVDADTGDVVLSDITGEKVVVDADTGDVNVKLSERKFFESLDCDLDTGNFRMTVPMGKEGFLETFATDFSTDLEDQIRFFGAKLTAKEASKKRQGSEPLIKVAVDTGMITIEETR